LGTVEVTTANVHARLNNNADITLRMPPVPPGLQRVADVPIYFSDAIVRRALSLQQTADAQAPRAVLSNALASQLGVSDGSAVRVRQGKVSVTLLAAIDAGLPPNVVRVAAAHRSTAALGAMFGAIAVEKA